MGIRDNLATLFGSKASVIGLPVGDQPDRPLEKTWDDWTLLSTYSDDPWPYICATKVAEQGSLPPLQIGSTDAKGNFTPVPPSHPLQDLFDRPNPLNTGGELRQLILLYMEMVGHAPIEIVRPTPGAKVAGKGSLGRKGFELYTHNPGPWRIVANADGTIRGYLYLNTTQQAGAQQGFVSRADLKWDATQMTYLRWPNPLNRWYGQGRIAAVRQAVMAEEYAGIRDKRFEQQMGVPPGILTSELPLGDTQAQELQRRWEKAVGGYQNAGRIAVLGSKTTYQTVALSRKDQEWLLARHWRVQEIAGAFEVPLVLVLMSEATYANAKEARAEWWEGSLSVKLKRIEEMANERLIPMLTDEPLEARFDLSKVAALGENALEVAQIAGEWAKLGSVKRVEIRAKLGLEPLGDERDDEIVIPSQLRETATAAVDPVTGEAVTPATPPAPTTDKPPAKSVTPRKAKRREPAEREQILNPVREQWKSDLRSYFASQRSVLRVLGKNADVAKVKMDPSQFVQRALELISGKRFRDRFIRISTGPVKTAVTIGATDAAESIGRSMTITAADQVIARVGSYLHSLASTIQTTTSNDLKSTITDWLSSEGSVSDLQDSLTSLFDGYDAYRVERIARTETVSAYNLGAVDQYRDAGVQLVEVSDGDGDDECAAADGATWTLDDAEADPISHPNCTRTWIPITEDFSTADVSAPED